MQNHTIADVARILCGFLLFLPFALFPGYVAGALSNALDFRRRSLGHKLLIAVPLSFATAPLLIYLVGRWGGMSAAWTTIGAAAATFAVLFVRDYRNASTPFAGAGRALTAASCWIGLALAILVDIQYKDRLYIAAASFDYAIRNEVISAITRAGVLPANPFFYPGHPVQLRYHYLFFLPCSMVESLSGSSVKPGAALAAGTIWCGLALMCLVCLYTRHLRNTQAPISRRDAWTGILMLPVIGLDVIPVSLLISSGIVFSTLDRWNEDIVGWLDSLLWAPHYVGAAIVCLTGFLVLWAAPRSGSRRPVAACVIAGAAFACASGMGIYVVLVFSAALAGYAVIAIWKGWKDDILNLLLAGTVAAILAAPYLYSLVSSEGSNQKASVLSLNVRSFKIPERVLEAAGWDWNTIAAVNLAFLPLNYTLELGVLLLVGILQAKRYASRRAPLGRKEWAEISLIAFPVLVCTFVRSSVIAENDLGFRGFLIPQFMLLLWSIAPVRASLRTWKPRTGKQQWRGLRTLRPWVIAGIGLGVAGTFLGAVINRGYVPISVYLRIVFFKPPRYAVCI